MPCASRPIRLTAAILTRSSAFTAKDRIVCAGLCCARIPEKVRRGPFDRVFFAEAIYHLLVYSEIVYAAPLVAVAGTKNDHFYANSSADRAGTLLPRLIVKSSIVPRTQVRGASRSGQCFQRSA